MSIQPAASAPQPAGQPLARMMVVTVDGFNMVVPGEDISTFGSVHDLETGDLGKNTIGWIRVAGSRYPVYCFSEDFEMSTYLLENRSICVVLKKSDLAFMCSDIKTFDYPVENILPLPRCMAHSATPVEGFCLYLDGNDPDTRMLCSARSIKKFIDMSNQ